MAITLDSDRQYALVAIVDFTFADFTSGVATNAIQLPSDAVVTGGSFVIDTAFDSGTSDTFLIGDTADADEYGSAIDGQAVAATALVPTGVELTAGGYVTLTNTMVGTAVTAGAGRLIVEYVRDGRSNENQG